MLEFDGPVAALERGDGILIGIFALKFVGGAAVEMEFELALLGFGDDDGAFGERDARACFRAGFEEEDTVPVGAAGGDIVDIENHVGEALVEDAWLHLEGDLRGDEVGFNVAESAKAARGEDDSHKECENRADDSENAHREENALAADAEGREGDDFAVHGHATKAEQDADQDGHREGKDKNAGDDAEEKQQDLRAGTRVAHEEFHQAHQLGHEQHEGEDEEAQEGVANDFANNVAIEDAHDEKGQCNMGRCLDKL